MKSKLLTIDEVATYLRINRFTAYRMATRGELPGIKIARQWRFRDKDLERWLDQKSKKKQVGGSK